MRRLFILFGSLVVLALLAALAAPPYVDWDQFRDRFETEASRILGQPVTVRGKTSLRLLPLPSVTFQDIRVGDREDGVAMLSAESFHMGMELAPLLKGDVVVVDMQLERPLANLHIDRDGGLDWAQRDQTLPGSLASRDVLFEKITVRNGAIRVRDARYKREFVLTDISTDASARTLSGPWRVKGFATYLGERTRLAINTGRWAGDSGMRLKVALQPESVPYDFEIDGPLKVVNDGPLFSGRFKVDPAKEQTADERIVFPRKAEIHSLPVRASGDVVLSSSGAEVDSYTLDVGSVDDPYKVVGSAEATFGEELSFKIQANGQQVNIERLVDAASTTSPMGLSVSQRLEALRKVLEQVPRFSVDGEVALSLPAIVAGDTVVRDVELTARPLSRGHAWSVKNLTAELPGRTELRADGVVLLGEQFGYQGELIVASRQPSGFAKWLGGDASPAIADLSSAGFSAIADVSPKQATLQNLEIVLGGETLSGELRRNAATDLARANVKAKLAGSNVNFDQLISLFDIFVAQNKSQTSLGSHDIALDLNAKKLSLFGVEANDVVADVSFEKGTATINTLQIQNIADARVFLEGQVEDFRGNPSGALKGGIVATRPDAFLRLVRRKMGSVPLLGTLVENASMFRKTALDFQWTANGKAGENLLIEGKTGGSELNFFAHLQAGEKALLQRDVKAKFVLVSPRPAELLRMLNLPVVPAQIDGRSAIRVDVEGIPAEALRASGALTLQGAFISAGGNISAEVSGEDVRLSGVLNVDAEATDFDPLIVMSGLPIPGFGLGNSGKLSAQLVLDGDRYRMNELRVNVGDTRVSGTLTLDRSARPRPLLAGALDFSTLDLDLLPSLVFTGAPTAVSSQDEAPPPLFAGIDGKIGLRARSSTLPAFAGGEVTSFSADFGIADGDIGLEDIAAKWLGGDLSGNVALGKTNLAQLVSGDFSLVGADLNQASRLVGFGDIFNGTFDVASSFESSGVDTASLRRSLTGSGSATVRSGSINGLDAGALPSLLAAADERPDESLIESASELAQDSIYGGSLKFGDADAAFSIASGQLRANNIRFGNEFVKATASVRTNFVAGDISLNTRLSYAAGKQAVAGAAPEISINMFGKPGAMKRTEDVALLSTYLGLRVSERREREFQAQQASILERQRLLRTGRLYSLKEEARRLAREERERLERLRAEEEERKRQQALLRQRELEQQRRMEAEIRKAEDRAIREAAEEAGRRERRNQEIEQLRRESEASRALSERVLKQFKFDSEPDG